MGWAAGYIERLQRGEVVQFRPHGNSMTPRVRDGQLVTVIPCKNPRRGDVVLCRVGRSELLHLVKAVRGERVLIGNNHGRLNGWTNRRNIFGRVEA
jgi:phage repressor protein C with HTH and peptisase S24 domain